MKKSWLLANVLALLITLTGVAGCNNDTPAEVEPPAEVTPTPPPTKPSFNLIFRYGPTANNTLDTFQGTFSKDMVSEPNIVINLALSEEEMDRIYNKMNDIGFFNYPDEFYTAIVFSPDIEASGELPFHAKPINNYYFKVEYKSQIKELKWTDCITNPDQEADKLRELIKLIIDTVESKEEYKELPEPKSPYLSTPAPVEPGFNMIFRYGVGASILDTFQGTYTKDMVMDPSITVYLHLSGEEKASIYRKMVEIDFFHYPDVFYVSVPPGESFGMVTPHSSYYFKVEYDAGTKELWWSDHITYEDEKADKLRELIRLIKDIIESKEEYQKLPRPRGGYI